MKKRICLLALGAAICAMAANSASASEDNAFKVYWKEGLRAETADKSFSLKIGGRIQNDWAFYSADSKLEDALGEQFTDGTEFRRARLYLSGDVYGRVIFKAQYDFAGKDADFKDVYLGLTDVPWLGTIKVGHFKEPFGLEQLTSSKYVTFLERSLPDAFTPERNTGIGFHNVVADGRFSYAAGFFRETDDSGDSSNEAYGVTARVTGLPWYDDPTHLLHLGAAFSHRDTDKTSASFAARPESHQAPDVVDTGDIAADSYDLFGAEAALVSGPFSVQGEYMLASVDARRTASDALAGANSQSLTPAFDTASLSGDPELSGYYVLVSYFLTGESRNYKTKEAAFDRVKPNSNFLDGDGTGALEVAVRYSNLDLNDTGAGVNGGEVDSISGALNWYLNPNTRVMLDYTHAEVDKLAAMSGSASADIVQTRFQIDF